MASLYQRIKKRFIITIETFVNDCYFSLKLAFIRLIDDWSTILHVKTVSCYWHRKKDEWILKYLHNLFVPLIVDYREDRFKGEYEKDAPIWICWWTGEKTAPPIVKQCIKSINKYSSGHPVNMITKDNYTEFLDIPEYILQKLRNDQMCIANFSDYLRFSLLEKYGGLWLDATIFVSDFLPEAYFNESLFTCKSHVCECRYISKFRWTSFCFGGWKGNILFRFFKDAFELYWAKNDLAIDYLLVDYIINIAYDLIPSVRLQLERIPLNNLERDNLQAAMNDALCEDEFVNVIKEQTILYKLSWREEYSTVTSDQQKSIYAVFLEMKL